MINLTAMIQLISQLKGFFYINPLLALSLAITIFSFVGIPPLVGFFAKQMVLSAALDNGFIFLALIAILTSVIGAVYYLNLIKEIFFYLPQHYKNPIFSAMESRYKFYSNLKSRFFKFTDLNCGVISSPFSITISIITLVILLFIFMNKE
jgi:NADH-ubiquinone oxidoreductase chain 2